MPSKYDVLSLPDLSETQKEKLEAIYRNYDAKAERIKDAMPTRPQPLSAAVSDKEKALYQRTLSKIQQSLTPEQAKKLQELRGSRLGMPSEADLLALPNIDDKRLGAVKKIIAEYRTEIARLEDPIREERKQDQNKFFAWRKESTNCQTRLTQLASQEWKDVTAILNKEQINALKASDDGPVLAVLSGPLSKEQLFHLPNVSDKQREQLKPIIKSSQAKSSKRPEAWDEIDRKEWSDIKTMLTAKQVAKLPNSSQKAPLIFWLRNNDFKQGTPKNKGYTLKVTSMSETGTGKASPVDCVISDLDDRQSDQIQSIIDKYRIRYAGANRKMKEALKDEFSQLKQILTVDQMQRLRSLAAGPHGRAPQVLLPGQ